MNIGSIFSLNGKIETETLSVVMAQIFPGSAANMQQVKENTDQVLEWMDKAAAGFPGFDLFLCPECCFQGYAPGFWPTVGMKLDGPEMKRVQAKCRELSVWGVFNPWIKPDDGKFIQNTAVIVNDLGEIVHSYVKMNPWLPGEPTYPGWHCNVVPGPKGSRLATIICADGDYPEIWREAACNGANVIVRVSHYMAPYDQAWEITNKAGAYCNGVYVVACNSAGVDETYTYFGDSMALNPDGTIFARAPKGIPWLLKADLYPGIIDAMQRNEGSQNYLWQFKHRGAAAPDFNGVGEDLSKYTHLSN
ncbi:MAG: hypothetical protein LBS10_06690 [Gracilibacteraceae bacterium]|jgi:amidase/formamidase|nr:hypothetical protein [Gracilibacteraceae bacterium]